MIKIQQIGSGLIDVFDQPFGGIRKLSVDSPRMGNLGCKSRNFFYLLWLRIRYAALGGDRIKLTRSSCDMGYGDTDRLWPVEITRRSNVH